MDDRQRRSEAATVAILDQIWAKLGDDLENVQRVALEGPDQTSPADNRLLRKVFGLVTAELYLRRAARGE